MSVAYYMYKPKGHKTALAFLWSHAFGHLTNGSLKFTLSLGLAQFLHQLMLVAKFVCPLFGAEQVVTAEISSHLRLDTGKGLSTKNIS